MDSNLALTILVNIILTAGAYLCVPVIIGFIGKKYTAKQIKRIIIVNGAVVWFIFAIIRAENNIQGSGASVFLWSAVAHWLLKANCLKIEESVDSHTSGKRNYNITNEKVYFDSNVSSTEEKSKTHPDNLAMQYNPEIADETIVRTTPLKAEPQSLVASQVICRKCGKVLSDETVFCPHCGKKLQKKKLSTSAKIILWILGILLVLAILFAVAVGIRYNNMVTSYNNALAAIEEGNFMIAQKYLQQIDDYEELFPEETAYINAAVLWEQGKNIEALKAFKKIRPEVPESIIEEVSDEIYRDARAYYVNGAYSQAKNYFTEIKDFENSSKYLTLISARSAESDLRYSNLMKIIGFEDSIEIIENSDFYINRFLIGTWKTSDNSLYFKMAEDDGNTVSCNLPEKGKGEYYRIKNAKYQIGNDDEFFDCYKFTIVDKETIKVYCYKNEKTYTMNRQ